MTQLAIKKDRLVDLLDLVFKKGEICICTKIPMNMEKL